ncbi:MAG: SMC family ATPase, partial [Dehalococcoidales bacterium]|nr:SMC family ATPase [Dehalococcoidales bacterium]
MPYRDNVPALDFTGIHTVSICGDNGNGKSAIIDAMTWALWGKTRAKQDDELIHQGQNDTEVEFEFAIEGQKYRIIRKHSRPKRRGASGQSSVSFQIASVNGFRTIDGDTMTQTQQKIIDVLHMDYNTFTNSAYLRQGHADEFTTSSPAKRKQVLANILGLGYYDEYEARAKDLGRQRELVKEQLTIAVTGIDRELEQKPASEAELQNAQAELSRIDDSFKGQEAILKTLRQQKELLESKRAQLMQLEKNITERTRTLTQWQEQIQQLRARIAEHEGLLAKRTEIEDGYVKFLAVKGLNDTLNKNLALVSKFNQRSHELEMSIERESQTLTKEHALSQSKVGEFERTFLELPKLKDELKSTQVQLQNLAAKEEILRNKKESGQEIVAQIRSAEADRIRLEKEIGEIDEKLKLLLAQPDKAKCPVCQTELGIDGLKHISTHYNTEKQAKADYVKSNISVIAGKKAELKVIEAEVSQAEKILIKEKEQAQNRAGALEREIARAEEAGKRLNEERDKLKQIEERLARKDFALTQQETLKQLSAELADLDYNPQTHEQARQELESLQKYEVPKRRLE